MTNNYNHKILKSKYDKNTGVIFDQTSYKKVNKSKGGWRRMYKDYTIAMEECINGKVDVKVWNILVNDTKSDFSLGINISKIAKKLNVSRTTIHSLINRMIENKVIKKIDDRMYEFNPFIYCPFGANDEMIHIKQLEWNK